MEKVVPRVASHFLPAETVQEGSTVHCDRKHRRREKWPGLGEKILRPDLEVECEMPTWRLWF